MKLTNLEQQLMAAILVTDYCSGVDFRNPEDILAGYPDPFRQIRTYNDFEEVGP